MKDFLQKPVHAPDGIVLEDGPGPTMPFQKSYTKFKLTFETISGVAVTLEGSNLENLHLIANKIK